MDGILLGIVVGLQLRFDWVGDPKRRISKPLILPALLLFYVRHAQAVALSLIAALFFCWLGDLFMLLPSGRKWRMGGPVCFGLGHVMYTATFVQYGGIRAIPPSGFWVLAIYPLWIWIGHRLMGADLEAAGRRFYLALIYAGLIGTMSFFAYSMIFTKGRILPFIGALIFIASDTMVGYRRYGHAFERNKFWVIATYMLAQILIVLGFVGL
jgi:uncharacterized membrane protein YhhN